MAAGEMRRREIERYIRRNGAKREFCVEGLLEVGGGQRSYSFLVVGACEEEMNYCVCPSYFWYMPTSRVTNRVH